MDFREIFNRTYANAYELLPFSDTNTVMKNVTERAEKTMNENTRPKYIHEVDTHYEERQANLKKKHAPPIGGIAAGIAAALGVGFFAGSIANGSFKFVPLKEGGAGYSANAETKTSFEVVTEETEMTEEAVTETSDEETSDNSYPTEFSTRNLAVMWNENCPAPKITYVWFEGDTGIAPSGTEPVTYDYGDAAVIVKDIGFDGMLVKGEYDIVYKDGFPEEITERAYPGLLNDGKTHLNTRGYQPRIWLGETNTSASSFLDETNGCVWILDEDGKTLHCETYISATNLCDTIELRFCRDWEEYHELDEVQTKAILVEKSPDIEGIRFETQTDIPLISGRTATLFEIDMSPSIAAFRYSNLHDDIWNGFEVNAILCDGTEIPLEMLISGDITDDRWELGYDISGITRNGSLGDIAAFRFYDRFYDRTDPERTKTVELYTSETPAVTATAAEEYTGPEDYSESEKNTDETTNEITA